MTHIIVGTAGHIDHGKTALVHALTGVDTDRLKEEKERGISIDLGFAHLDLEGLRLAFIDVPGHERFIKNMLAGATAIDAVLFVISADESIKPQTREHFAICQLLGIPRGIIALTKCDLVDAETLLVARMEVEEFIAGSFLEGAPIVPVSARTGEGIDNLRADLVCLAKSVRGKSATGPFRMPVDRAFSVKGFGAVVTGAITAGMVETGQELSLWPEDRRVRVRGIETHGEASTSARAGQRCAINLAGAEVADLHRGQVLAEAGRFRITREAGCRLRLLAESPALKHRSPVHIHAAAASVLGEVRLLAGDVIPPGGDALVKLVLSEPLLLLPGERFIVRRFSPVETIGGGVVIDPFPPAGGRRAALARRLAQFEQADAAGRIALLLDAAPFGLTAAELAAWGFSNEELAAAPAIAAQQADALRRAIAETLKRHHAENPLLPGMAKEEIRSRLLAGAPPGLLDRLLDGFPDVVTDQEFVRLRSHRLHLKSDEDEAMQRIENQFREAGLAAPAMSDVLAKSGVDPSRARSLLQILLRDGRLVRIAPDLVLHQSAMEQLHDVLQARKGMRFGVPDFKDWTGVSRKYAIPLLEYLDRVRITRRDGDQRVIL
jgi:selenocysteine-specific elongation factor